MIYGILEKLRYFLTCLVYKRTSNCPRIHIKHRPIQIFNEAFNCIGFSATGRPLKNESTWEGNIHCSIIVRMLYNINNMIHKEGFQLMTSR